MTDKRDQICEATVRIVARAGFAAVTIDGVAREAGLSKGGVLHHFPTKDELLVGATRYFGEKAERMLTQRVADDPRPRRRWARAFVDCVFPDKADPSAGWEPFPVEVIEGFMNANLAAVANGASAAEPLRELGQRLQTRLLADGDGLDQLLVWLAVDGVLMWEMLGLVERSDPLYTQIGEALRRRVNEMPAQAEESATPVRRATKKGVTP
ncbi:MAG: TetR family transcriptional regulator [Lacipirellulaceae bacterium]